MLRRAVPFVVCLAICVFGCKKREGPAPPERPHAAVPEYTVPPGMVAVTAGQPVFITTKAATVGDYVDCLRALGEPPPDRLNGLAPAQPVTGLTRREAERFAAWSLKRLPTAEEWEQAPAVVGSAPWPWGSEGSVAVRLHLVQDWLPGDAGEEAARARRAAIEQEGLTVRKQRIARLCARLTDEIARQASRVGDAWKQFKPALFSLLDKQKDLAALQAAEEARASVRREVEKLAQAKMVIAHALLKEDVTARERAARIEEWNGRLAAERERIQKEQTQSAADVARMQAEVMELTALVEKAGSDRMGGYREARGILEQSARDVVTIRRADEVANALAAAIEQVQQAPAALAGMPTGGEVAAQMREAEQKVEDFKPDAQAVTAIKDLMALIERQNEQINATFEQEPLLFREMEKLVEIQAKRGGIRKKLDALRGLVDKIRGAGTEPE